ncbi:MAG: hypothetical protein V3U37_01440 [Nitrospinaceae bacterium]
MKKRHILFAGFLAALALCLSANYSFAGLFDDDEQNWEKLFLEIKKINARLVDEISELKTVQNVQVDLLRQVEEIKHIIPNLQGAVEQSKAETISKVNEANKKLADLEAHLKNELSASIKLQKQSFENLRSDMDDKFNRLTGGLAQDMEKLSKSNKQYFLDFSQGNKEALDKIVAEVNRQNQRLDSTNTIIRNEMIPAITEEHRKNREEILSTLNEANKKTNEASRANTDAMVAGFKAIQGKNDKLIEILGKSFAEEQETRGLVDLINKNVETINKNLALTHETTNNNLKLTHENITRLKDILSGRLDAAVEERKKLGTRVDESAKKTGESLQAASVDIKNTYIAVQDGKENFQVLKTQNDSLIASTKVLAAHSEQMEQKLEESLLKVEASQQEAVLANQKLAKLIEILKTIALEQSKIDQVVFSQKDIKGSGLEIKNMLIQAEGTQKELKQALGALKNSQGDTREAFKELKQILGALKNSQGETKEALADLRRKANVNIARNDDIKKALKKIKRRVPSSPAPAR